MIVAVLDAFLGRALKARDLFAFLDVIGGGSNRLVDECPVVIEIDHAAEFDRMDRHVSGINVE